MAALGELVVSLSANTAKFNEGLNKAQFQAQKTFTSMKDNIGSVGTALAGTFTIGVFANFVKGAIQAADAVNDIVAANEVAVSTVLKLQRALTLSGGEAESAANLFSSLTKAIDSAAEGTEKTQQSFAGLGITLDDLRTLDGQQIFEKTLTGLKDIEDPIKRNALAMDLLGKAVKGVDVKALGETFANDSRDYEQAEKSFEAIGLAMDRLDILTMNTSQTMAEIFGPALLKTIEVVDDAAFGFGKLEENIRKAGRAKDESSIFKAAPTINDKPMVGQFKFDDYSAAPTVREVTDPAVKKAQEAAKKRAEDAAKAAADLRKKMSDEKLRDLQSEINFEFDMLEAKNKKEVELEEKTQKEISDAIERYIEIEQKRANDNFEEAQRLAKETTNEWQDAFEELKNSVDGYSRDMSSSLAQFALGGKMSFADMIDSMLLKLLEFANQKLIFDPLFKSISGAIDAGSSNGGGLGGFLSGFAGSLFGSSNSYGSSFDSSGAYTGGYFADGVPIDGFRANGGMVSAGRNYIVGERGAEMFVPSSNGTIIPNGAENGSNVSIVINNNSKAEATAVETKDARGNRRIEVTIAEMVASEIKRSGSSANQAIGSTFSARPRLVGR